MPLFDFKIKCWSVSDCEVTYQKEPQMILGLLVSLTVQNRFSYLVTAYPRPLRKNLPGMTPVGSPSSKVISPLTMIQL